MSRLDRLREKFWFVPASLCVGAALLAWALIQIDEAVADRELPWPLDVLVYTVGESGGRDLLGAIATSSLAVAGTTFSITMAVLALTSSSYGPRLVRNFMADRGNQFVLGVYVATFLYSILILRSIRAIGDPGDPDATVFVPDLAVNFAVLLAVLNVGVLIYFIHHISSSIQISSIAGRARNELHRTITRLYPEEIGDGADEVSPEQADAADARERDGGLLPDDLDSTSVRVCAQSVGFVQSVRSDDLLRCAIDRDLLIAVEVRPGDHVIEEQALALVHPAESVDEEVERLIRRSVVVAGSRSPVRDIEFAVAQLIELAVRALSPGTNDPYTALNALDDLASGLSVLAARAVPSAERFDDHGVLRVHVPAVDAADLVSEVLDHMRWYATEHPSVMGGALDLIERVGAAAQRRRVRARLVTEVRRLGEAVELQGWQECDVEVFRERAEEVVRGLARN